MAELETQAAEPKTEQQLMQEMQTAVESGDFKLVAKVATELAKFQKAREAEELKAKQEKLAKTTLVVKEAIDKLVSKLMSDGKLDNADGVWYNYDFGTTEADCRLYKAPAKARSSGGGGGAGKKFDVKTEDLLAEHAAKPYKETGMTYQQAWDSAEGDKNARYAVRMALLKEANITS